MACCLELGARDPLQGALLDRVDDLDLLADQARGGDEVPGEVRGVLEVGQVEAVELETDRLVGPQPAAWSSVPVATVSQCTPTKGRTLGGVTMRSTSAGCG